MKTKETKMEVIKLSDNLFEPQVYVAEIHIDKTAPFIEYAVQIVGRDEGKSPTWIQVKTVALAKKAIKETVKAYADARFRNACAEMGRSIAADATTHNEHAK
jgi:hypothetical protein